MKAKANTPAYKWGDLHGRGPHPVCADMGATHWPLPAAHEGGRLLAPRANSSRGTEAPRKVTEIQPKAPRPVTTTGLITREDFFKEAERLGVIDAVLTTKIAKWFLRTDVGEGMKRMQCNQLLRNAVKKKAK